MKIEDIHTIFQSAGNISTDSRTIKENDIFWALKGDRFDGNSFIEKAFEKGAAYAVSDTPKNKRRKNVIYVQNSLKTLQELAYFHRKKIGIKIIALTGTNGKTTTKELIAEVLSEKYAVKATKGNLNNHIGVPLTLLSFHAGLDFGITEMGANRPGEIKMLCEITEPDFGLITNIGKAHLEGFGSFEGLKNTKKELYDHFEQKGIVFFNKDNALLESLLNNQQSISYGTGSNADYQIKFISAKPFVSIEITAEESIKAESKLIGSYNFENISAAVSLGMYFQVPVKNIKHAVESYVPQNNRSQIIKKGNSTIISDAYNANPSSVQNALENFFEIHADKKVIMLGDMFELGDFAEIEHERIVEKLLKLKNDQTEIFTAGKEFMRAVNKKDGQERLQSFQSTDDLIGHIKKRSFKNAWILIKGSRGMQMETVIEYLKTN